MLTKLPSSFDLLFDIKSEEHLKIFIDRLYTDLDTVEELCKSHGLEHLLRKEKDNG